MSWNKLLLAAQVIFSVTVVINLFLPPAVIAQEVNRKQEATEQKEVKRAYEIETITVTAEKREEKIQEVPVSITALSDVLIEDAGIVDVEEMIKQIPNMSTLKTGYHTGHRFFIRGIGGQQPTLQLGCMWMM